MTDVSVRRVRRLLSGASTIAIVAALANTTTLAAGQFFGPGNVTPIVISADTDFVNVTNATVAADGAGSAFVVNTGVTIDNTAGSALVFQNSTFLGSVTNNGSLVSAHGVGWQLSNDLVIGDLDNNGYVHGGGTGEGDGLAVFDTVITGSIRNTGSFIGDAKGANGVTIGTSSVGGDIINSGHMTGGGGLEANGLEIDNSTVSGAIRNQSGGVMNGGTSSGSNVGLRITNGTFVAGGIFNDGSILGGSIGTNRIGIYIDDSTIAGGIHNTGSIKAGLGFGGVVITNGSTFAGGIDNGGSIQGGANGDGIFIGDSTFAGGINNHSWIAGGENGNAISMTLSNFGGGIHNFAGGSISSDGADAIHITSSNKFVGGLLNEGHIDSFGGDAIEVDTVNFTGKLDNAGLITSSNIGIHLDGGYIADGIFNSGTIQAPTAINMFLAGAGQTVTQTGGKILGDVVFSGVGTSFFVGKGGYFKGDMLGTGLTDELTVISGTWSAEGGASEMGRIAVTGGTGVFGGKFYGDLAGTGFDVVNTSRTFLTTAGRAFIDDNSDISVFNDATFGAEGALEFLLTSNTTTHGVVTGGIYASLDGRLASYYDWNSFAGLGNTQDFSYQGVIRTADLQGAFDNENDVDTNSIFFTATATQRLDQFVDINAHRIGFDEILTAPSNNQKAVGDALEDIFAAGGAPFLALEDPNGDGLQNPQETNEGLYSALFQLATTGDVANAYASLDGHVNAAIIGTTFTINDLLDRNIQSRLEDVRDSAAGNRSAGDPMRYAAAAIVATDATSAANALGGRSGWSAWARAFGSWGNADGDAANEGFDQDSKGFGMGVDYATNGGTLFGVAGQFASTDIDFDRPVWSPVGAHAEIDSGQAALYGYHSFGMLFVDANASATFNSYDTVRRDFWGQPIISSYDATVYSVYGELGADLDAGRFNLQPYAGLGFRHANFDNFTERCPFFCLAVAPEDAESLYSALGVRATATYHLGRTPISPEFRLAWQHEFDDDRGAFDAAFVGAPGSPFHVEGQSFADDKVIVGAGISAEVTRNFVLFADYNGSFSSDFDAQSVAAGFRVTW